MNYLIETGCVMVSVFTLLGAMVRTPTTGQCPPGWFVAELRTGTRGGPLGQYTCARPPIDDHDGDTVNFRPGHLTSRIHCTGGTRPIRVDARTVGCQR